MSKPMGLAILICLSILWLVVAYQTKRDWGKASSMSNAWLIVRLVGGGMLLLLIWINFGSLRW